VTTVSTQQFDQLLRDLTSGAVEMAPRSRYDGLWYQRADGVAGVRRSDLHGLTIDIVNSQGNPQLPAGTRFHFDD
jgi:hypothetical protein